jgi:DNA-binding phage protein
MSIASREADVNRESLYRSLSTDGNPGYKTLIALLDQVGLKIALVPKDTGKRAA